MADTVVFPKPSNPRSTKMVISTNVRLLMTERGVTQMALAAAMQLPQTSISKRLRGVVAWDAEDLDRLVQVFDVGIDALVLPRLDSNQQPAASAEDEVNPGFELAEVVELAAWAAR
jgi:transcriptional regulator with XRE-family HTH domain